MISQCTASREKFEKFEGTGRLVWNDLVVPKLRGKIESIKLGEQGRVTAEITDAQFNYGTSQDQDWRNVGTKSFASPRWQFIIRDGRAIIEISALSDPPRWFNAEFGATLAGELGKGQLLYLKSGQQFEQLERMPAG